jgi:transcriptional regulator GlxA family with amidase domain
VSVLLFDGVVLGDVTIACEIFGRARDANGRALYDVRFCSEKGQTRTDYATLGTPWRLNALSQADLIIVPGPSSEAPIKPVVLDVLRRAASRGVKIASICTGAYLLAAAGLLDGRRATTHWRAASELAARFPKVNVDPNVLFVDEGQIATSAGATAGFDLCLHLVRRDFGARVAASVARDAVLSLERAGGQAQFIEHTPPNDPGALAPLLTWAEKHLDGVRGVPGLAKRAAMSLRTLSRQFSAQLGTSPAKWLVRARINRAQQLLETTRLDLEAVAGAVGFSSAAVLRSRFRAVAGTSPQAWRRTFQASTGISARGTRGRTRSRSRRP